MDRTYIKNDFIEVDAATYDVLGTERTACLHVKYTDTGTVTITFDSDWIAIGGNTITIKDTGNNASVNNITVETEGAETIEGSGNLVINVNRSSVTLQSDGSNLHII